VGDGVDANKYAIGKKVVMYVFLSSESVIRIAGPDCYSAASRPSSAVIPRVARPVPKVISTLRLFYIHSIVTGMGGGLSEYVSLPHHMVHVVPDSVELDVAACIEPLCVAWHAVHRGNFKKGDTCLIAGSGPIGLFVLKVLKSLGASAVYVSEPAHQRRTKAQAHHADVILNPGESNVVNEVMKLTNGRGVDIAFECAGVHAALETAIMATKAHGTIINIAGWEAPVPVNINLLTLGEKTLTSSAIYANDDYASVIEALGTGLISNVSDLITKRICLEDVVNEGYMALANDKDNQVKILVYPGKDVPQ